MNKPVTASDLVTPKVTTGPLVGSRKIYSKPEAAPDLRVPLREIVLSEGAGEPNLPVYDTTGVYTDNDAVIDVENGPEAHPHRMGQGARRRRGIRRPPDQAGRQRQRHAASTSPATSPTRRSRGARSMASRSRNTNSPRPASSPRR